MKDITDVAFESYKEDLKSYDNPDYVIHYPKYDWKMSYIAYDAMLKEYTDYHNLNQPDTDYETFGEDKNYNVFFKCLLFKSLYIILEVSFSEYKNYLGRKGFIKRKDRIYYIIKKQLT
ncbi:hypothetical protein RZ70_08370 [Apilactobacillus kunkeei]|uniref:hypothetical protein n=1 Tax=Apilactobacillus kunkeei TaxID=148814 RepID=UPI0006C45906|nr:hypothetical protein [Apilactobacillus kunkeei]KOY76527.1 hypothetical protein RZ70_08370 [Apilactobacillus kunkeei]